MGDRIARDHATVCDCAFCSWTQVSEYVAEKLVNDEYCASELTPLIHVDGRIYIGNKRETVRGQSALDG